MGGNHLWLPISSENGLTAQVVGTPVTRTSKQTPLGFTE
jgi:hypothetical protein